MGRRADPDRLRENGAQMRSGLAAVGLLALLAACGPFCNPTDTSGQAKLNLIFTGPEAGKLTSGNIDCRLFNHKDQFNALITGKLGQKDLVMNIQVPSGYHGADTYKIGTTLDGAANVRVQIGEFVGSSPPTAGQLIMTTDRAGVVDSNLGGFASVTGSFVCADLKSE
ncbi:MAG TPA: hypothetical protein VN712_04545 [Dermatophilaceae bacterium]|nr:hypothetical protein [Dermatophilaceae bacterium]